jgi:hypothetical protein
MTSWGCEEDGFNLNFLIPLIIKVLSFIKMRGVITVLYL